MIRRPLPWALAPHKPTGPWNSPGGSPVVAEMELPAILSDRSSDANSRCSKENKEMGYFCTPEFVGYIQNKEWTK